MCKSLGYGLNTSEKSEVPAQTPPFFWPACAVAYAHMPIALAHHIHIRWLAPIHRIRSLLKAMSEPGLHYFLCRINATVAVNGLRLIPVMF